MNLVRTLVLSALIAAASLGSGRPATGQDVGRREVDASFQEQEGAVPASLQDTYRRLADSWQSENARAIASLARDGRVYVAVQREGIGDRLAASQLQYLLEELFEASDELQFRFPAYSAYDPSEGTGYAVGERVYREGPGHEPQVDRVFVGARNERGRWVLTELRLTID